MDIRIFLFVLIVALGLLFKSQGDTKNNRRIYIDLILLALVLESCLRGLSVGTDTYKYSIMFENAGRESWSDVFSIIRARYIENVDDMDAGYLLFQKIVHIFSDDFNFFLLVCALCFFIPFRKLLHWADLSMGNLIMLFVLYVALFNPIAMSGTRKEIALGFSILCFLYYIEKKYVKAVLWLLFGSTIHMSMILILLFPVMDLLSITFKKVVHGITFLLIPVIISYSMIILLFMANFVENEHYQMYAQDPEGGGMTFVVLMELILFGCFILFKRKDLEDNQNLNHLYSMAPMATLFVPLITNNGSMIRISQYFHLYIMILLPLLVNKFAGVKYSALYRLLIIAVLIVMSLNTGMLGSDYHFFWENVLPDFIE